MLVELQHSAAMLCSMHISNHTNGAGNTVLKAHARISAAFHRLIAILAIVGMPALEQLALPVTQQDDSEPTFPQVRSSALYNHVHRRTYLDLLPKSGLHVHYCLSMDSRQPVAYLVCHSRPSFS